MKIYPICQKFVNDYLNSGDKYYLWIEIWLKKDWFNRNIFFISYTDKNCNSSNYLIRKDISIDRILDIYWFNKNDKNNINWLTIKQSIQNVIDFRNWKIKYL